MEDINEESIWLLAGNLKGNLVKTLEDIQGQTLLYDINAEQICSHIIWSHFLKAF